MSNILEIRMQRRDTDCSLCGSPTDMSHAVPSYNGDIVSNDFPDWLHGIGGGSVPVCRECYEKHDCGEVPTFDRYYRHLFVSGCWTDGGGI